MDTVKIGIFLAQLRKERNLTQEQLGEHLGVTNKTVSRWENGNYLPPVEMLQQLSEFYEISINEILSGERLAVDDYREKAEENIKTALNVSAFTLKEKTEFYKKKWLKEHIWSNVFAMLPAVGFLFAGVVSDDIGFIVIANVVGFGTIFVRRNTMMTYVEDRAFDGSGKQ